MARKMVPVALCDHCQRQVEVTVRRLQLPATGRQITFDTCEDCRTSVPLSDWEKLIPTKKRATAPQAVVSVDHVKKMAKPAPRKRVRKG